MTRTCVSHLVFIHFIRDANGVDSDALTVRNLCHRNCLSGIDDRLSVSDDDGDVGYPGPVYTRDRELHRAHLSDTAGRVRAPALM